MQSSNADIHVNLSRVSAGKKLHSYINKTLWMDIALAVPALFLVRLPVFVNLYVIGPAYVCAMMKRKRCGFISAFMAGCGLFLLDMPSLRWKYGAFLLLLLVADFVWDVMPATAGKSFALRSAGYSAVLPLSTILLNLTGIIKSYSFVMVLLETAIFYGFTILYERCFSELFEEGSFRGRLSEERLGGMSVTLGTLLAAIAPFRWGMFSLYQTALVFCSLFFAYGYGAAGGLLFSVPAMVILRLCGAGGESIMMVCCLEVLLCGIFRELGKVSAFVASFAGGLLFLLLFMGNGYVTTEVLALAAGGAVFFLLPDRLLPARGRLRSRRKEEAGQARRIQRYISRQMRDTAETFDMVAAALGEAEQRALTEKDMAQLFEDIARRTCQECEHHAYCWGSNFYGTYQTIFDVVNAAQTKGKIERGDVSPEFLQFCEKGEEFVRMVNRHFEVYRLNLSWENRLGKSVNLAQDQLREISKQMRSMEQYMTRQLHCDARLEHRIEDELMRRGIRVSEVSALFDTYHDRMDIALSLEQELGGKRRGEVQRLISHLAEREMEIVEIRPSGKGLWKWRLQERLAYKIACGLVSIGKMEVNGDSYVCGPLRYGRYLVALSDGMGTGEEAKEESALALELLEKLLNMGMEEVDAIRLLNSVLVLHSRDETFTTLDLGLIDLISGHMHLAKSGGAVTFLKSQDRVRIYRSDMLPIGIMENVDVEVYEEDLQPGDVLVMISDGVLDQTPNSREAELVLKRWLLASEEEDPQRLADGIQATLRQYTGQRSGKLDDITILTAVMRER